jgi:predicted DNA-binding transcriptional regulator
VFHKLKKREIAAYYLLLKKGPINLGEAVDIIAQQLCTTKKTARNIVKRLIRLGLVEKKVNSTSITVSAVKPERILENLYSTYSSQKRRKCYSLSKKYWEDSREG